MLRLIGVRDGDRGAIAMMVAMLFGFGVMIGVAALTIDVGNINANRRQLQNGADAVALAAVKVCAETGVCPDATNAALQKLENANANPGAASGVIGIRRVDGGTPICGFGGGLPPCPSSSAPDTGKLQECPAPTPALAAGTNYLRVYTQTTNAVGSHLLPYSFGAAIAGVGSGANQQTCATVTWGPPSGAAAPITLSYCEWAAATGYVPPLTPGGTPVKPGVYYPDPVGSPGYVVGGDKDTVPPGWPKPSAELTATSIPTPVPGQEIIIGLQGSSGKCASWNTHDAPGGFGYLSTSTGCDASAVVNGWISADSGNTLPGGCPSMFPYFNKVLYLPVFDCTVKSTTGAPTFTPVASTACLGGAGLNTWYHIMGYAKFYLSGYTTSGGGASDVPAKNNPRTQPVTPQAPCSDPVRCLSGWFLQGLVYAPPAPPSPPGSPLLGAYSIKLAG